MNARLRPCEPLVIALTLVALVLAIYQGVGGFGYVQYDDPLYVFENPVVRRGLSLDGVVWAFTSFHAANWHPLTWLSHMTDVQLFGLDAGWHHRVNVAIHAANSVLLFLWLFSATRAPWRSAFVAALFASHPLHVQSVAWIAERKDVLSTFFWLITTGAYVLYVRRPSWTRYGLVSVCLALGLMAKPMVVTLPVVLLLLDVWPLGRLDGAPITLRRAWPLVQEKLPFMALALASSVATVLAQSSRAIISMERLSLPSRVANAVIAYSWYLLRTIWPGQLAVYYPHRAWKPGNVLTLQAAASAIALVVLSALAAWQWRRRPFLAVGWGWYMLTLLPVIGLVQVGFQGMADRYTYVPLIGIFIAVAWALPSGWLASPLRRAAIGAAAILLVLASAVWARVQVRPWRDTLSLFGQATRVSSESALAWKNLGAAQFEREALRSNPGDPDLWANLAFLASRSGDDLSATEYLERAVFLDPADEESWMNLAIAYGRGGRTAQAQEVLMRLKRIDPAKAQSVVRRLSDLSDK